MSCVALIADDIDEGRPAKHAPNGGIDNCGQALAGTDLAPEGFIERQRIVNPVAGECIDDQALLIGGDHLLLVCLQIENPPVELFNGLNERCPPIKARLIDSPHRLAKLENERAMGLIDDEGGKPDSRGRRDNHQEKKSDNARSHRWPPVCPECCRSPRGR